jgi:hypothetical protein
MFLKASGYVKGKAFDETVRFVTWAFLSDVYENVATLLENTWDYDGDRHATLQVQAGMSEEFDLTPDEYDELVDEYPNYSDEERITFFFERICRENNMVLLTYEQMEQLEKMIKIREE